jgi:Lrp/AsnC family transcriptional regulator, leucine-responsive regulatory protein
MEIDATDRQILELLQENSRITHAEIGRRVGLVPSSVCQRVRRLEQRGIVESYSCVLNGRALDVGLVAFVMIRTNDASTERGAGARLAAMPHVLEVHRVVGDACFIVKTRVRDTEALDAMLQVIATIPSVVSTRTTIVVRTMKETLHLPLAPAGAEQAGARYADGAAEPGERAISRPALEP